MLKYEDFIKTTAPLRSGCGDLGAAAKATVIILHYGGVDDTITCLASVVPQCHSQLNVLVVDNGGTDKLEPEISVRFGAVPILRLTPNRGWAGGNNAGIVEARQNGSALFCLLNNDTIVPTGAIDALIDAASRWGPCLLHPVIDFADPLEGAQLDPAAWPRAKAIAGHADFYRLHFAYGACLMIPSVVFDQIGLFDERFFVQLEETDFFHRADRLGIASLCYTGVRIRHAESKSFGGRTTPEKTYYAVRNSLLLAIKNIDRPRVAIGTMRHLYWKLSSLAKSTGGQGVSQRAGWFFSNNPHAHAAREAVADFARRRFGQRWPSDPNLKQVISKGQAI